MRYNFDSIERALEMFENGDHTYDISNGNIISRRTGNPIGTPTGKYGYIGYNVRYSGFQRNVFNHRAIFALINGIDALKSFETIDHINGNMFDNRIENLQGLSNVENVRQAKMRNKKGNKLTFAQVRIIKQRLADGVKQKDIAFEFGVSGSSISHIATGKSFAYL